MSEFEFKRATKYSRADVCQYEKCNEVNPRIYKPDGDYVTRGYSSGMIKILDIRKEFCKIEPCYE